MGKTYSRLVSTSVVWILSAIWLVPAMGQTPASGHDQAVRDLREARDLVKQKQLDKAEKACLRAIEGFGMRPGIAGATDLLGEIYVRQGLGAEALAQFSKFARFGRDPHVDLLIAVAAARTGDMRSAKLSLATYIAAHKAELESSLCRQDELPGIRDMKLVEATGLLLLGAENTNTPDEALDWLQLSGALAPKNPVTQYLMGKAYAAKNDWGAAKRYLSEAAKGSGKSAALARESLRRIPR